MLKKYLTDLANDRFNGQYSITKGQVLPKLESMALTKTGTEMELAMLFVDIEESTKIVSSSKRITAAKMYKTFLWGMTKIVNDNNGEVRSFNGDGVLAVFAGSNKHNNAVRAAMKMVWFLVEVLKPKMETYFSNNQQMTGIPFNFRIGIDEGTVLIVRGGYRGDNNNDLVWIGNPTNYAVKYSKMSDGDFRIHISETILKKLTPALRYDSSGLFSIDMWKPANMGFITSEPNVFKTRYYLDVH